MNRYLLAIVVREDTNQGGGYKIIPAYQVKNFMEAQVDAYADKGQDLRTSLSYWFLEYIFADDGCIKNLITLVTSKSQKLNPPYYLIKKAHLPRSCGNVLWDLPIMRS